MSSQTIPWTCSRCGTEGVIDLPITEWPSWEIRFWHAIYGTMMEHWGETGCQSSALEIQLPVDTTTACSLYMLNGRTE